MNSLSRKEQKHYRKLVVKKLEDLNIKDEIRMNPIKKTKDVQFLDPTDNKIKVKRIKLVKASNMQRNIVKKILQLSKPEVEVFLATDLKAKIEESKENKLNQEVPDALTGNNETTK